jgi:uncharacterized protein YbbC (DUF1343 family)
MTRPVNPRVRLGIDRFAENPKRYVGSERVALLCHAASVDGRYQHLTSIAAEAGLNVVRCFGPEHGIWADAQDMEPVDEGLVGSPEPIEPTTGAPVTSLYGHSVAQLKPTRETLEGVETLIIDLQDIGTRYYTYIYTACLCAQVCAEVGARVLILDRPNPLGGVEVEGRLTRRDHLSFVGMWPLPNRHGLTLGEVVRLLNEREGFGAQIDVLEVEGWSRDQLLSATGQRWVLPSPNMPSFEAMMLYPGACLIEGTQLSEARGTTKPFEWVGAGGINPFEWARELNALELPGVCFRPLYFKPTFHKWAHQTIGGVEQHITDPHALQPLRVGMHLLASLRRLYGEEVLAWREEAYEYVKDQLAIDLLFGGPEARELIDARGDIDELWRTWQREAEDFKKARRGALIYP